jgi:enoyl-CoA hydratase
MPKVIYEKREQIAYVTLNRPEAMNAIDLETHELLWEGDEAFCAGADLKTHLPF